MPLIHDMAIFFNIAFSLISVDDLSLRISISIIISYICVLAVHKYDEKRWIIIEILKFLLSLFK